MPEIIAIAISDLHLSLMAPACRADKDWLAVQAHYLQQVKDIAEDLPVLCSGDIFDRWNPPPELIHFALVHLPDGMISVPGQHDLPNHRIDQVNRSGYGVLMEAEKIRDVSRQKTGNMGGFIIHGFGWGQEITPPIELSSLLHIALIHRYCWEGEKRYLGAPIESEASTFKKELRGYQIAIFGDNHFSFVTRAGECNILNPGGFIRRKSDEINREPCVGIVYDNGTVKRRRLDTTIDTFHEETKERGETPLDMRAFIKGLEGLGEHGLDFREAVKNHLRGDDIEEATKEIIWQMLDKKPTEV